MFVHHLAKMVGSEINFLTLKTKIMKTLELENFELIEMTQVEMRELDGGKLWESIIMSLIDNWDEFKAGVSAGFAAQQSS
jgi:hypothetical protein